MDLTIFLTNAPRSPLSVLPNTSATQELGWRGNVMSGVPSLLIVHIRAKAEAAGRDQPTSVDRAAHRGHPHPYQGLGDRDRKLRPVPLVQTTQSVPQPAQAQCRLCDSASDLSIRYDKTDTALCHSERNA